MDYEKENSIPQGDDNSNNEALDSTYALPEKAKQNLTAWLFAMRSKKYRRMKQLKGGEEWSDMRDVAREFHSSSPGEGLKVDETADADVIAFQGESGPEVTFVEREASDVGDVEPRASDGVPVVC